MHLDDERLQRLLHGELEPGAETSIMGHLATCDPCRDQLTAARREAADVSGDEGEGGTHGGDMPMLASHAARAC